jgi:hypothetical protein
MPAPLSFRRAVRGYFRSFLLTGRVPSVGGSLGGAA